MYDPEKPWTWPDEELDKALEELEFEYKRSQKRAILKLRDFIKLKIDELDKFEMDWMRNHRLDPDKNPLEMPAFEWETIWQLEETEDD
jgi:hypothetical protein